MRPIVHLGKHYFPDAGGIETATKNLAEAGATNGNFVTCIVAGASICGPMNYSVSAVQVKRCRTLGKLLSTPLAPALLWPKLPPGALVHIHLPNPVAELGLLARLLLGNKVTVFPFVHALPFQGLGLGKWWYRMVTKRLLRLSQRISVSSESMLDSFPLLQEFSEKITVLPFAATISTADQTAAWQEKRRHSRTVLALGRLVSYKGYAELIRAWHSSRCPEKKFSLVIIGNGPQYPALQELIQELGIADSVKTITKCSDEEKEVWFQRASLFVMPSLNKSETFGISALEAMAHGLPLIASDIGTGLNLLARGGRCGALVQPGSQESLRNALEELLLERYAELPEIGESNRSFVEEKYSQSKLQNDYKVIVRNLER